MAKRKEELFTPLQALEFGVAQIDAKSGRERRGRLGTFQLADIRATTVAALDHWKRLATRVDELCAKHGEHTLIAEAQLSAKDLETLVRVHPAPDLRIRVKFPREPQS
jgi:hypothetical protein